MATSDEKHFRYIWLDAKVHDKDGEKTQRQLTHNFGRCKFAENMKECQTTVDQSFSDANFVLIVSGQFGRELVPMIEKNPKIWSIYVYCGNVDAHKVWADKCDKVKHVSNNLDELINRIKANQSKS